MIFRRVMEHFRRQEWTAIGIDFGIVVVGVFVGMQVTNWNEAASEQRALAAALGRLQTEMTANIETMDVIDAEVGSALPAVQAAADALVTCQDDAATRRVVNEGLPRITATSGLRLRRSAIDELTSDPRLLALQSPALRRRLADVSFYADLAEERARFYEQAPIEARVEENPNLRLGSRHRVTASYFGIDYSKDRRPLELAAPVSVACQDHTLVNAFNTWERWQQNLPVLTRKMRVEYQQTQELLERERR